MPSQAERRVPVLFSRSNCTASGFSKTLGSRLAAGNGSSSQSPSFRGCPWKSKSLATRRAIVTGA